MKWQWNLLLPALLAGPALAQESYPEVATPPTLTFATRNTPTYSPEVYPGPADTSGDRLSGNHNFPNFINWLSNPLQNIDPRAVTAIYPIFSSAWVSSTPPIPDGDGQVYGPAITVALSDGFAMGLNQGGFAVAHLSGNAALRERLIMLDPTGRFRDIEFGGEREGWLNIGGFFQYTFIENCENQLIATGGLRWIAPCGSHEIFQGHGPAELAPYLTAGKEFGKFHVLATVGYEFPVGPGSDNVQVFDANVHIDRQIFGWLYPLVEFNSNYQVRSVSFGLPTHTGFLDFDNFEAEGNIVSLAAGANAVLIPERLELGAAYTTVIASQHNFNANGLIVKMTLRY